MKYIVSESQLIRLSESFSLGDLRRRFEYIFKLDKKKHPGADTYKRYSDIKDFQKWVDLLFKYTKQEAEFDGVKGLNVATVWSEPSVFGFPDPNKPPERMNYKVRIFPDIDENNPPTSQETFDSQYQNFRDKFVAISDGVGVNYIMPVKTENVKEIRVRYNFLKLLLNNKSEMKEGELTEKCWPGYTQKGLKTMFGKRYPNCVKKKK